MSRTLSAAGVSLFFLSFVGMGTAFSDEREPSRLAETARPDEPDVRRTVTVPVQIEPKVSEPVRAVPRRAVPVRTVPVRVQHKSVQARSTDEVADRIEMDLLVVELRGNVQRALQEADFHEIPVSQRYVSATVSDSGHGAGWLRSQLQSMKAYADVDVLSRPHVRMLVGQPAEIQVGREAPQTYLVRTGSKTFELREVAAQPTLGLSISLTAQPDVENPGQIEISPLKISTTTLDGREPVPGVNLDIGKPIISTRKLETSIRMSVDEETSGIVLPSPSDRHAVLFLCVRRVAKEGEQIVPNPTEPTASPAANPKPNP